MNSYNTENLGVANELSRKLSLPEYSLRITWSFRFLRYHKLISKDQSPSHIGTNCFKIWLNNFIGFAYLLTSVWNKTFTILFIFARTLRPPTQLYPPVFSQNVQFRYVDWLFRGVWYIIQLEYSLYIYWVYKIVHCTPTSRYTHYFLVHLPNSVPLFQKRNTMRIVAKRTQAPVSPDEIYVTFPCQWSFRPCVYG